MQRFFRLLPLLLLIAAAAAGCIKSEAPLAQPIAPYTTPLHVGSQTIFVEVVDNDQSRQRGLADRNQLTDQQGMLFDFHDSGMATPRFWMKGMRFGLDFVWIKDNRIIGITPNAPVENKTYEDDYTMYSPPGPVDSVLEVNAGWARTHSLKVGDTTKF